MRFITQDIIETLRAPDLRSSKTVERANEQIERLLNERKNTEQPKKIEWIDEDLAALKAALKETQKEIRS